VNGVCCSNFEGEGGQFRVGGLPQWERASNEVDVGHHFAVWQLRGPKKDE
jgi:hypothetical protein